MTAQVDREELRRRLTPLQFSVTQEAATAARNVAAARTAMGDGRTKVPA